MARERENISIEVDVIGSTEKALKVAVLDDDGEQGEEVWVPRSLVCDGSEVAEEGDSGELVLPMWFGREKGLTD